MSTRLDLWLTQQGLAPSRTKARALISSGFVQVNGQVVTKVSSAVTEGDAVDLDEESPLLRYVSRGGLKLAEALRCFHLDLSGARVLDIGSSTGGFTDCALQHGAAQVFSVDVGTDCMDAVLAADSRVRLYEQTDIRVAPDECFEDIDYVVCDASFVSLLLIAPTLQRIAKPFRAVLLIKPQFECGAALARRFRGVITDPDVHVSVVARVVEGLAQQGLHCLDLVPSPLTGGDGNREYLALFEPAVSSSCGAYDENRIRHVVDQAFSFH